MSALTQTLENHAINKMINELKEEITKKFGNLYIYEKRMKQRKIVISLFQ